MTTAERKESKLVELEGRYWLTLQLFRAGLEVARPEIDYGIDLIAYREQESFVFPIQMKSATDEVFSIDSKYGRLPRLTLVYVWYVRDSSRTKCFALTFKEAIAIADAMGYTKTESWRKGSYVTNAPSEHLKQLLAPYEITSAENWSDRFATLKSTTETG